MSFFLYRFKDVFPKELQSHTVYKCACCNFSVTYYGKNECHLNVGSKGYLGISLLTEKRVECKPSAVSDHLLLPEYDCDLTTFVSCVKIIMFQTFIKRSIKLILISRDSLVLNKNTVSFFPLLLFD